MTTMNSEIYDALKDAGASEEKSRLAAEAVADYKNDMAIIRSDLRLLKWMIVINTAFVMSVFWKTFS